MNIFSKLFGRPIPTIDIRCVDPEIRIQLVSSHTLTMTQWRKQEKLVTDALALSRNGTFQMMMQVLQNEHPARNGFVSTGVSADDRAAHQAKTEGYEACLNKIKELSQPWSFSKPLVATFSEPETKK